jgi:TrmH family RNA methyltransferase
MRLRKIESARNPLIKETARLMQSPERDARHAVFVIEGANLIEAALARHGVIHIRTLMTTERFREKEHALMGRAGPLVRDAIDLPEGVMARLSGTGSPRGGLATVEMALPSLPTLALDGVTVIADGIADPGNLGTLVRTAEAAGASAFIATSGTCDLFGQKALRASAGSALTLPVAYAAEGEIVEALRARRVRAMRAEPRAGRSVFETDLRGGGVAIVFGNEAHGPGEALRAAAGAAIHVPVAGHAESLNVAASAAVILFEAYRQREAAARARE